MYFDRFDIVEAYYCYFMVCQGGLGSEEYERLSRMFTYFWPRSGLCPETLTENGREIYENLVKGV